MAKRTRSFSIEIYPPKTKKGFENLKRTLAVYETLEPDFVSVTCSDFAANFEATTLPIIQYAKAHHSFPVVAHLAGHYLPEGHFEHILNKLIAAHVDGILALRGDIREDATPNPAFPHATDLITALKKTAIDIPIYAACYPEQHPDSVTLYDDIHYLKAKEQAGAQAFISQLFFDNELFFRFLLDCRLADIASPIIPGVLPIVKRSQVIRLLDTTHAQVPRKFRLILDRYRDYPHALRKAGIAYAIDQIIDLLAQGAPGVHLYALNRAQVAETIYHAIEPFLTVPVAVATETTV